MRIGCLQFAPSLGDLDNNLNRADKILNKANPEDLDLLVLPELAFTGYNFPSLRDISPFLEPTGAGITSVWARTTALKYNTKLVVGYPEKVDVAHRWPTSPEYFNSAIIVDQNGDTIGHYRKTHLYYTDETWALEGSGFYKGRLSGLGNVAMGICMDINPYRFEAPWHAMEFAFHVLDMQANLVILSMAWLTREDLEVWSTKSQDACMDTLTYWVTRLEPLIRAENDEEIIVVFCNRTGVEDDAIYAGTSAVIGIQNGEVTVYGMLGRGQKELLVVDTDKPGFAKLVYRPEDEEKTVEAAGAEPQAPPSAEAGGEGPSSVPNSSETFDTPNPSTQGSEPPVESGPRNFQDHIFINSDTFSASNGNFPNTEHNKSPVSPRYFWKQPPSPTSIGTYDNHNESRASLHPRESRNGHNESPDHAIPRNDDIDTSAEFSALVNKVMDPAITSEAFINRPSSTKSRTTSRHRLHRSQPISSGEEPTRLPSRGARREQGQDVKMKSATPELRDVCLSPDLEKLGADLMVFEGDATNRPKRDSLVCHVDEDDYVILRAERKDGGGKKKSSKSDAPNGRPKPNDTPSGGRSHSRNKVSTGSPTHAPGTGDRMPARPASRGRHRSDSANKPKSLSKKASYGRVTSNGTSPVDPGEIWGSIAETSRHARHQGEGRSGVASPPSHRHRQDPVPSASKPVKYKSPEPIVDREVSFPVKEVKHRKGDSRSGVSKGAVPSPQVTESSPRTRVSPTIAATKIIPERVPPTPKAMILPPDYDNGNSHQSMPAPPRKQVVPLKCLDKSTEVQGERPRSAVW